jgi:hypothetical protein
VEAAVSFDTIVLRGFAGGDEIEVPCDRIDAKLDEIWREIAKRSQIAVHRACLLNLVVHAGDNFSEVAARFLASSLTDRLPARVIVVRARPGEAGEGAPRAFVAASRHPAAEGRGPQVSGEVVVLDARGAQLERVPAIVRATLEPDLATTLWWTGPVPPARPYVAALRDLADRVVIDSDDVPDDVDVSHLLPAARRVADLAWPRLAPWRTAIARAFDAPEHRAFLASIDRVTIGVGARSGGDPEASAAPLLAGWLAAALRWRACVRRGDRAVCFAGPAGSREATVCIEGRRGAPRGVADVALASGDRVLTFRRSAAGSVEANVPAGFSAVRPALLRDVQPLDALASTLLEIHADPIAPESIRRAAEVGAALCAPR